MQSVFPFSPPFSNQFNFWLIWNDVFSCFLKSLSSNVHVLYFHSDYFPDLFYIFYPLFCGSEIIPPLNC